MVYAKLAHQCVEITAKNDAILKKNFYRAKKLNLTNEISRNNFHVNIF